MNRTCRYINVTALILTLYKSCSLFDFFILRGHLKTKLAKEMLHFGATGAEQHLLLNTWQHVS